MTAKWIDGVAIANEIKADVGREVQALRSQHVTPGLAAVLVGENPASQIYVQNKVRTCESLGIYSEKIALPASISARELIAKVQELNQDERIDGILVQSPLPDHIDKRQVYETISPDKDVDGFHPQSVGKLCMGSDSLQPCTPAGIIEILRRTGVPIAGSRAVVLGRSDIVGKPVAVLLMHNHATVTICHTRTRDLPSVAREADILVAAMGKPAMVTAEYIKPGAVVIDVGISRVSERDQVVELFGNDRTRLDEWEKKGYTLVGDVHPRSAATVAQAITPVPGGVGPLTIAVLMRNTVKAAKSRRGL